MKSLLVIGVVESSAEEHLPDRGSSFTRPVSILTTPDHFFPLTLISKKLGLTFSVTSQSGLGLAILGRILTRQTPSIRTHSVGICLCKMRWSDAAS